MSIKRQNSRQILIICGPTASGKTNLAHNLAKQENGEIVNCDSMQIYKHMPLITASPSDILKHELPYHLYNFLEPNEVYNANIYTNHASAIINKIWMRQKLPIIVGGSGLYISSLICGLNNIPTIQIDNRQLATQKYKELGAKQFRAELIQLDSRHEKILPGDTQRLIRAYEIFLQTGNSIYFFQKSKKITPLKGAVFNIIYLKPERNFLYSNCHARLENMFNQGIIEEIKNLDTAQIPCSPSASKVLGGPEIRRYLAGEISLDLAKEKTLIATRQYAKRQITWFNNQLPKIIQEENYATCSSFEYENMNDYKLVCDKISTAIKLSTCKM